jgi:hypothetical protein
MYRHTIIHCLIGLVVLGTARAHAEENPPPLAAQAREVLKKHCHRCHGIGFEVEGLDVLDVKGMTKPREGGDPYLTPGKPDKSYLFVRVKKGSMPPKKEKERPTDQEKEILRKWIEAGAPEFPKTETRPFHGSKHVLTAIRDHLRQLPVEDRPFQRFFTLTNLHNHPKHTGADLRLFRAALSKAVNSLSWKPRITLPTVLDKEATVFVLDIRDLDWDRDQRWRAVMAAYPYGLSYTNNDDADIAKLAEEICEMTACELPIVRVDWFVATATRPPLYHVLLSLPHHAGELERILQVDVEENFLRDRLIRGGFATSGVSGQNRLVERHDGLHGAYWKSYDFKKESPRSILTEYPLGPSFPRNPHNHQAFQHDGGEIIFSLPNGLQGYLLVDGKDQRIDEGPIEVVSDSQKISGEPKIVNGVSCMNCHKHGMIDFTDTIRAGTTVRDVARRKVQRLYPEKREMEEKVKEDRDRFLRALEKAVGPFLLVAEDKDKKLTDFTAEPVGTLSFQYRVADLDLAMVACELDIAKPEELKGMIQGNRRLREMGLASLLQPGGTIKRHDWEGRGGRSLMQRVAAELGIGKPLNVAK